jgi:hypothetical protein
MKIIVISLNILLVIVIMSGCSSSISQQIDAPEEIRNSADKYISERTGDEFFKSYINLLSAKTGADSLYTLIYRFHIPGNPYIDEEIRIITDKNGKIRNAPVTGIPECMTDTASCEFNIDESEAIKIAVDNGLSKGKGWRTDFAWQPEYNRYVWKISSVHYESEGTHGYRGNGEIIIIDPGKGMVLDKSEWYVR